MSFTFALDPPSASHKDPVLISGDESRLHTSKVYVLHWEQDELTAVFEIRYDYHVVSFKQAELIDQMLVVGHESHLYVFDIQRLKSLLVLKMEGYFCNLYTSEKVFYATDAQGVYAIDKTGKILWTSPTLGIDGVIIEELTSTQIVGSGEYDPPGGWINFVIDKRTGQHK